MIKLKYAYCALFNYERFSYFLKPSEEGGGVNLTIPFFRKLWNMIYIIFLTRIK